MCAFDVSMMNPFIFNAMELTIIDPLFDQEKRREGGRVSENKEKSKKRTSKIAINHSTLFHTLPLIRSKFNYIKSEPMFEIENSTMYLLAIKIFKKGNRKNEKKETKFMVANRSMGARKSGDRSNQQ